MMADLSAATALPRDHKRSRIDSASVFCMHNSLKQDADSGPPALSDCAILAPPAILGPSCSLFFGSILSILAYEVL